MLQRRAVSCCSPRAQTRGSAEGQAGRRAGCSAPSAETKVSFDISAKLLKETVAWDFLTLTLIFIGDLRFLNFQFWLKSGRDMAGFFSS